MPETAQLGKYTSGTQADIYLTPRLIIHSGNWKPVINTAVHTDEFIWDRVKNETMETAGLEGKKGDQHLGWNFGGTGEIGRRPGEFEKSMLSEYRKGVWLIVLNGADHRTMARDCDSLIHLLKCDPQYDYI